MYHAYKIEFESPPMGPKTIAAGCSGALKKGLCSFKAFIGYIAFDTHGEDWKQGPAPDFGSSPDVQQVRRYQQLKTWGYEGHYESRRVIGRDKATHDVVLKAMTDSVQNARKLNPTGWQDELDIMRSSAERIHAARAQANHDRLIQTLRDSETVRSNGIKIETVKSAPSIVDNEVHDEFDSQKTLDGISDKKLRSKLEREVASLRGATGKKGGQTKAGKSFQRHAEVARTLATIVERLNGNPDC